MQSTGQLLDFGISLAVFVYVLLLLYGKVKLRQDFQIKLDDQIRRRGRTLKIAAFGGAAITLCLILIQVLGI
jgi:hypothetical protein